MPPGDLLQALSRRPFVPFCLHVSDGTTYDVRHPEMLMVAPESAVVGRPGTPFPLVSSWEIVALAHVVRLVPLEGAKAAGDGAAT